MIDIISEEKVSAIVLRKKTDKIEMLVFTFANTDYRFSRIPGGGVEAHETPLEAVFREITEESGIEKDSLIYLRKMGKLEYFKPLIHKKVVMHNFLFLINTDVNDFFECLVGGDGKDNGLVFHYHWIEKSKVNQIDPELSQLINEYNLPEFYIDPANWGLKYKELAISPHDIQWKRIYEFEEIEIRENILEEINVEHIGSTSIPHLYAKPIIDILIGFSEKTNINKVISGLQKIGYRYHHEHGIEGRYYFTKGNDRYTFFHIHAFQTHDPSYKKHLRIRNVLSQNEELRERYQQYKQSSLNSTRLEYTENKQEIMDEILNHPQ